MANYSLPRLERLNCSMGWESGILGHDDHWLSPKVYIFYNLTLQFFFENSYCFFKNQVVTTSLTFVNNKVKITPINFKIYKQYTTLGYYIYSSKNCHTTLVLYKSF